MNSAERRMNLLLLLQSRRKDLTADTLASYFGVSRRTIFRDLRMLSEMEVPVTFIEGEGYAIPRGYTIPPLMFTPREIAIIMFGLSFVRSQNIPSMISDAKAVELKIQHVLPAELKGIMSALDSKVIVDPYLRFDHRIQSGGDWFQLTSAIAAKNTIRFRYSNSREARRVDPYLLVYYSDHWNIIGFCHDRQAIRNFRVSDMLDLAILPVHFQNDGDPIPVMDLIYRSSDNSYLIDITIDNAALSEFKRSVPARIETSTDLNAMVRCTFQFDKLDYINNWLMRFSNSITVNGPTELIYLRNSVLKEMLKSATSEIH